MEGVLFFTASVLAGVSVMFICYKIFRRLLLRYSGGSDSLNPASAVFLSGLLLCVGMYIGWAIQPIRNVYTIMQSSERLSDINFFWYLIGFLVIAVFSGIMVPYLSFLILDRFTDLDEIYAIKNNQISVSVITITIVLMTVWISRESFVLLLDSLVPYPPVIYKD
ncbi:MAG: hypothetical protein IPM26_15170 [Saprospiraceae bacterium]|nr:hypothetical protein [Saprospiraceae bacterium]